MSNMATSMVKLLRRLADRLDGSARRRAEADHWASWYAWESNTANAGYVLWTAAPAPLGVWIEATRREWPERRVVQADDLHPEMNVGGLWWRPWKGETIEGAILDAQAPHD